MNDSIKLRVKFQKSGAIRYIGHLDVMRFFQKCIRRAEIDVCYTGGFSPHQIMSFAAPLSVGLESMGEYMDIEVHSVTSSEDMMERFNQASVPGIRIVSVKRLPENAGNAMASVAAASYSVGFRPERTPLLFTKSDDIIEKALENFLSLPSIPFTKEGKKGMREIDLKEGIYHLSWEKDIKKLDMLLNASSSGNIKPEQIIRALLEKEGQMLENNALLITRKETYTDVGREEPKLIPMDEVGELF